MRHRPAVTALILAAILAGAPAAATEQRMATLREAQNLALRAVAAGQAETALALADAILAQYPRDSFAHLVRATALLQAGQARVAGPEARRAFHYAQSDTQRFEAARVAALAAARQDRFLVAQFWMRRAMQAAPGPQQKASAVIGFRNVRQAARAAVQLSFSVAPSNNVNGGSSDRYNVIDGVPLVGVLSGSALALPGTVARGSARLRYRLAGDNRTQTDLTGALQLTRVHLSDEAHAKAPGVDDADFGSTYAELGLRHARLAGPRGGLVETEAELGRVWSGGTRSHDVARASLSYSLSAGKTARMTYSGTIQRQFGFADGRDDVDTGALAVSWQTALANRDQLTAQLARSTSLSDNGQAEQTATTLTLGYRKAAPLGPVTLGGRISWGEAHYPSYAVGFIGVPGGRQDTRLAAEIDFGLTPLEYMGFVPTVTLTAEQTDSNVSRFTTDEVSLSIGFRSAF